jgi:hypothetical protein
MTCNYAYVGSELHLFRGAHNWKRYIRANVSPFIRGDVLEVGAELGATPFLAKAMDGGGCGKTHSWQLCTPMDLVSQFRPSTNPNIAATKPGSPRGSPGVPRMSLQPRNPRYIPDLRQLPHPLRSPPPSELQRSSAALASEQAYPYESLFPSHSIIALALAVYFSATAAGLMVPISVLEPVKELVRWTAGRFG